MRRRLFREEAYARRGQTEPIDRLLRVTAPHEWVILGALGLALLGIVLWCVFGRLERSLSAACILVESGERHPVVSGTTGIVTEVLVSAGEAVEAGQPIAQVRDPELARRVGLARVRLAGLEAIKDVAEGELSLARAEARELEVLHSAGESIVSPYAGELAAHNLAPGHSVQASTVVAFVRLPGTGEIEAVALLVPADAKRLDVGMAARIVPQAAVGGDSGSVNAEVWEIARRSTSPPGWLTILRPGVPTSGHVVRLVLSGVPPSGLADGATCSVRIVVGQERPWQVLVPFRTN